MHEKIKVRVDLSFPDEYDELFTETIKTGKNLTVDEVNTALIQYLTNTDFPKKSLYFFQYSPDNKIKKWLAECKGEYTKLTVKYPYSDNYLQIGTFKSYHKYANYGNLYLEYERRYLENE